MQLYSMTADTIDTLREKEKLWRKIYRKSVGSGDDIDTDIIIPTEYLALKTIEDMKQYGFSTSSGTGRTDRKRRYYCSRKELWLRFFKRTGTGDYQSTGCKSASSPNHLHVFSSVIPSTTDLLLIEKPDLHDDSQRRR